MALNVGAGMSSALNANYLMSAALIVFGIAGSALLTDWVRENVIDLSIPGADAVYGVALAAATLTLSRRREAKMASLGMAAGGIWNEAQNQNLV